MTFPQPYISSVVEAIGQADTMIGGHLETFLKNPLDWDATEIVVAATERWPDPSQIKIEKETIAVTTKDEFTFTITSRPDARPSTPLYLPGTLVADVTRNYSDIDIIRRQMLLNYATEDYLTTIGHNYGVPRPTYKGMPLYFTDDTYREFLKIIIALQASPLWGIMRVLHAMFPPITSTATTSSSFPQRLTFAEPAIPENLRLGLVRLDEDWDRVHRIVSIDPDGEYLEISAISGPTWAAADLETVGEPPGVSVEILAWDAWEEAHRPGEFFIQLYQYNDTGYPWGASYLQGGEPRVSATANSVLTRYEINHVFGVWLATDTERTGTNYWEDGIGGYGTFSGKLITLGQSLTGPGVEVVVDYGNVDPSTAQLLTDVDVENAPPGTYWPFYLSDYAAVLEDSGTLDIIRALGMLPVVSSETWGSLITPAIEEDLVLASGISFSRPSVDVIRLTPVGVDGSAYIWVTDASGNSVRITVESDLDCDLTGAGAGGLQTGDTYSADTGYQVVLIAKGDQPVGYQDPALISMENGADNSPVLPSGYTHWSVVLSFGSAATGPDLVDFRQFGNQYFYLNSGGGVEVESVYKGTGDSNTDCSAAVPYYATEMAVAMEATNDSGGVIAARLKDKDGATRWSEAIPSAATENSAVTIPIPHERGVQPEIDVSWSATGTSSTGITARISDFTLLLE